MGWVSMLSFRHYTICCSPLHYLLSAITLICCSPLHYLLSAITLLLSAITLSSVRHYTSAVRHYIICCPPLHYLLSAITHLLSFDLRFLITPLVFSNFYLIFFSILLETILIVFMHIRVGSVGKGWRCKCRIP